MKKITIIISLFSLLFLVDCFQLFLHQLYFLELTYCERGAVNSVGISTFKRAAQWAKTLSLHWDWSYKRKHYNIAPLTSPRDNGYFVYISILHQHLQLHSLMFLILKQTHFTDVDKALKIFCYVTVQKTGVYKSNFTALLRFSVICTAQKKTEFKT